MAGMARLGSLMLETQPEDSTAGKESHLEIHSRVWCVCAELSWGVHWNIWARLPRSLVVPRVSGPRERARWELYHYCDQASEATGHLSAVSCPPHPPPRGRGSAAVMGASRWDGINPWVWPFLESTACHAPLEQGAHLAHNNKTHYYHRYQVATTHPRH